MSIRNTFVNVKNFLSNLLQTDVQEDRVGESGEYSNRPQPQHRFLRFRFGGGDSDSDASRKRSASNLFEPEITDDEDDFPGNPQPFSKRLRLDSERKMPHNLMLHQQQQQQKQHKYTTRTSGVNPNVQGVDVQPWEFNFNSRSNKSKLKQTSGYGATSTTTTGVSRNVGELDIHFASLKTSDLQFHQDKLHSSTSKRAKKIEVVTLDDDDASVQSLNKASHPTENLYSDQLPMTGSISQYSSREASLLKRRMSSPMKQKKYREGGGNRLSNYFGNITKRFVGNSTIRGSSGLLEVQRYKELLKSYNLLNEVSTRVTYKKALTKSRIDNKPCLEALYNTCTSNSSNDSVTMYCNGRALAVCPDPGSHINCKPTSPLLPRLYSTPISSSSNDYSHMFLPREGQPKQLAIQPTPELVDLEKEVVSQSGKNLSVSISSPSKPAFTNLEDAINKSVILEDLDTSQSLAIEASEQSVNQFTGEADPDISIISEQVITKSRNCSVNTLALEQTSCRYVDKRWLDASKEEYKDNKKGRDEEIRKHKETLKILRRESTLEKDLEEHIRRKLTLTEIIVLEEPPLEFFKITEEIQDFIQKAKSGGNENQVLAEVRLPKDTISITRGDVRTLRPSQWLNDNVINTYMGLIVLRSKLDNYPAVYAFQTFFYPKLLKEGYSNSLKRWTRKDDIFAHDLIILPIHLGLHWCLACIDLRKKTINYYDSLGGDNKKCLVTLMDYICREMKERKQVDINKSEWGLVNVKGIPQQENGSDCGMFACKFAEYLSRDAEFTFNQQNMPYFRDRMIYELLKEKLLHP